MTNELANCDGRTALHVAAAEGHLLCVRFLIQTGAQITALDRYRSRLNRMIILGIIISNVKVWKDTAIRGN
jgi:ankyrin repeat protein